MLPHLVLGSIPIPCYTGGMRAGGIPFTRRIWWVRWIRAQASVQQLTSELSSGVRVTSLSRIRWPRGKMFCCSTRYSRTTHLHKSANLVTGQLQVARFGSGSVVSQLTQAISLATSANNGTMNFGATSSPIANQISGILNEVTSLANTVIRASTSLPASDCHRPPWLIPTAHFPATRIQGDE